MKRISFNNITDDLRPTIVEINDNERIIGDIVITPKYFVAVVFNQENSRILVVDREFGLQLNEPIYKTFTSADSIQLHP